MNNSNPDLYVITYPERGRNHVELWSSRRLPFEPRGWIKEMRNDLRCALKLMDGREGKILYTAYSSMEQGYFDVENVLFYNVNGSAFSHLQMGELVFERRIEFPPGRSGAEWKHYQQYMMTCSTPRLFWRKKRILAQWEGVTCPVLKT